MTQTPRKKTYEQLQQSHDEWMETAKLNFSSYKHEKNRADAAEEEARYQKGVTEDYAKGYRLQELRAIAAEAREQRLKEAVETIKELSKWDGISTHLDRCYIEACDILATLYPDTPAPKEGK